MKNQNFGVEVEMINISRDKAAKVAAELFGTNTTRYAGTCYDTYEAIDQKGRTWKFMNDSSLAGPTNLHCELVTPILKYEDIETLQELVRRLRKAGAKSNADLGCGIHIHVDAAGHTPQTIRNLVNIMAGHESLLTKALKIDQRRIGSFCRPVNAQFVKRINAQKPQTMSALADVWYGTNGGDGYRGDHYNPSRYHMLNLHATFTKGTIEFRLFQFDKAGTTLDGKVYRGGIHAGQLKSYIQLCLALSAKAKAVKTASPKEPQHENEKYAMRTWLLRLGFIGDEFKTARDILTRNLTGNAAWRRVA